MTYYSYLYLPATNVIWPLILILSLVLQIDVMPTAKGCYDKDVTAIPKERMRSFMGQEDCFGNSGDMTPQEVLEATTGYYYYEDGVCESDQNCIQEDESGWFVGSSCLAKSNLQYNKNPFQLNYYCRTE